MADPRPLRLATYNVEWFDALFDNHDRPIADMQPSSRYQVNRAEQLGAIAIVFSALNADGIMIIEAPNSGSRRSSVRALENFARQFELRTCKAATGFASETEQEISFLYDPDRLKVRHAPRGEAAPSHGAPGAPRFDTALRADLDGDGIEEVIRFSKPPLELLVTYRNKDLRLIGVHAKSKSPHGPMGREEFNRLSIDNRRKQLAECRWLRRRVEEHLAAGDDLIVMGDFNDGPGIDEYEKLFGHSGIEIVLGLDVPHTGRLYDPHADLALSQRVGITPTSARFWLQEKKRYFEALLDFIMVSPNLVARAPEWRIWHPFDDPGVAAIPELREAVLQASDHFPVTIDLSL